MPQYALLIDYEYCSGCQSCEVACKEEHDFPVGVWGIRVWEDGPWKKDPESTDDQGSDFNWNNIPVPTDMCDLCADRIEEGRDPFCVHHCLADCMKFGLVEEMAAEMAKKPKQVMFVPCD